jgi:Protein of unknown function (DUF3592)
MDRGLNLGLRFGSVGLGCLVSLCICLCGAGFAVFAIGDFQDYQDSANWKTASGEVLSSEIEESTSTDSNGTTSTTYRAAISYRYFVNDTEFTGDRVRFGDDIYSGSRSSAQETADKYSVGTQIDVLYDPDDPSNSVVERDLTGGLQAFLAIGGGFMLCAVVMFIGLVFVMPFLISRFQKKEVDETFQEV